MQCHQPGAAQLTHTQNKGCFMNAKTITSILLVFASLTAQAQNSITVIDAARVFDGERMHTNWLVAVEGSRRQFLFLFQSPTIYRVKIRRLQKYQSIYLAE